MYHTLTLHSKYLNITVLGLSLEIDFKKTGFEIICCSKKVFTLQMHPNVSMRSTVFYKSLLEKVPRDIETTAQQESNSCITKNLNATRLQKDLLSLHGTLNEVPDHNPASPLAAPAAANKPLPLSSDFARNLRLTTMGEITPLCRHVPIVGFCLTVNGHFGAPNRYIIRR